MHRLPGKSKTKKMGQWLRSQIQLLDGSYTFNDKNYLHSMNGAFSCDVKEDNQCPEITLKSSCKVIVDQLFKKPIECHLNGSWEHNKGICSIQTSQSECAIKEMTAEFVDNALKLHADGSLALASLTDLCMPAVPIDGMLIFDTTLNMHNGSPRIQGTVHIDQLKINEKIKIPAIACAISYHDRQIQSSIDVGYTEKDHIALVVKGDHERLSTAIDIQHIKPLITHYAGYPLEGRGTLNIGCTLNFAKPTISLSLDNGFVRLGNTYNGITHCALTVRADIDKKLVNISNTKITFNEGSASCNNGTIKFDDAMKIDFFHMPIIADRVLINCFKNMDLIISGALTLNQKKSAIPELNGTVFIDDCQIRGDLLSNQFSNAANGSPSIPFNVDCMCDIGITSKKALALKTSFAQVNARANIHIGNTIRQPSITGSINLDEGILHLPYKSLFLTKGAITFGPEWNNPFIELIAGNTIKNHDITLQLVGPLHDIHCSLSAMPYLTENQITSLLLVGSKEDSLHTIIPALATQGLKIYFKEWLEPLKHVHLVPLFNDQTARGGIRAAFEIEVGDRLRALIQKNFTLTEDTRLEVEYLLSDDLTIRGVRDERRDVNAEVELRWKF